MANLQYISSKNLRYISDFVLLLAMVEVDVKVTLGSIFHFLRRKAFCALESFFSPLDSHGSINHPSAERLVERVCAIWWVQHTIRILKNSNLNALKPG